MESYRHVCDICLASIFNHHYFCPGCAIDICLHCYDHWNEVEEDRSKTACYGDLSHSPQTFTLARKYSEQDIDAVTEKLDNLEEGVVSVSGDDVDNSSLLTGAIGSNNTTNGNEQKNASTSNETNISILMM
jgi:hypothetical protein